MSGQHILVVDDEPKISRIVAAYLQRDGFHVQCAADGRTALDLVTTRPPDLVVLDLMLPEVSGWDICRELRRTSTTTSVPIIILSARDDTADRIVGLELGADDYVVKPFDPKELVARVRAVLRRTSEPQTKPADATSQVLQGGDLTIDLGSLEARRAGQPLALTRSEFQILAALIAKPGRVFSRMQLLNATQGDAFEGYERTIDGHVKNLRRKIEPDPRHPCYIQTVFGVGYKFVDQDRADTRVSP